MAAEKLSEVMTEEAKEEVSEVSEGDGKGLGAAVEEEDEVKMDAKAQTDVKAETDVETQMEVIQAHSRRRKRARPLCPSGRRPGREQEEPSRLPERPVPGRPHRHLDRRLEPTSPPHARPQRRRHDLLRWLSYRQACSPLL